MEMGDLKTQNLGDEDSSDQEINGSYILVSFMLSGTM
jgi:hypothetical protein